MLSEQHVPVVIDTGCTRSVTPFRNDFDTVIDTSNDQEMVGLKDGVSIKGEGYVNWTIRDAFGHLCAIRTMFTKASPRDAFRYLRSAISGWQIFARECHEHIIHDGIHKFPQ